MKLRKIRVLVKPWKDIWKEEKEQRVGLIGEKRSLVRGKKRFTLLPSTNSVRF